nr:glycoprotein hormone beta-5-like [Lytechinus pictus]
MKSRMKSTKTLTTTMTSYRIHRMVTSLVLTVLVLYITIWPTKVEANGRLGCHVRQYLQYKAEKPGCRPQNLVLDACFGRCDTYEVPELEFPFKSSHHEMCSYHQVQLATIELDDCDPGVNRTYTYRNARSCKCRNCSPYNTFCFGLSL